MTVARKSPQSLRVAESEYERLGGALCAEFARLYGHGPTCWRLIPDEERLLFSFEGGLSACDALLLDHGHWDQTRRFREAFVEAAGEELARPVAAATDLAVAAVEGAFHPHSRRTDVSFALALTPLVLGDKDAALRDWGEQARRRAVQLRCERDGRSRRCRVLSEWLDTLKRVAEKERKTGGRAAGL